MRGEQYNRKGREKMWGEGWARISEISPARLEYHGDWGCPQKKLSCLLIFLPKLDSYFVMVSKSRLWKPVLAFVLFLNPIFFLRWSFILPPSLNLAPKPLTLNPWCGIPEIYRARHCECKFFNISSLPHLLLQVMGMRIFSVPFGIKPSPADLKC